MGKNKKKPQKRRPVTAKPDSVAQNGQPFSGDATNQKTEKFDEKYQSVKGSEDAKKTALNLISKGFPARDDSDSWNDGSFLEMRDTVLQTFAKIFAVGYRVENKTDYQLASECLKTPRSMEFTYLVNFLSSQLKTYINGTVEIESITKEYCWGLFENSVHMYLQELKLDPDQIDNLAGELKTMTCKLNLLVFFCNEIFMKKIITAFKTGKEQDDIEDFMLEDVEEQKLEEVKIDEKDYDKYVEENKKIAEGFHKEFKEKMKILSEENKSLPALTNFIRHDDDKLRERKKPYEWFEC